MKTILLVNESKVTLELIKVYLIVKDVRVLEARDGVEALIVARSQRPDLILADLRMPRLDGIGLCRQLRADPALHDVPVIILSNERDHKTLAACKQAGARVVLFKPIGPHALHDAVERHAGIAVGLSSMKPGRPAAPRPVLLPPQASFQKAASGSHKE